MAKRTTLLRKPDREVTDRSAIHAVLDEGLVAHVGVVARTGPATHPVVIPMLYVRDKDR